MFRLRCICYESTAVLSKITSPCGKKERGNFPETVNFYLSDQELNIRPDLLDACTNHSITSRSFTCMLLHAEDLFIIPSLAPCNEVSVR